MSVYRTDASVFANDLVPVGGATPKSEYIGSLVAAPPVFVG